VGAGPASVLVVMAGLVVVVLVALLVGALRERGERG
jgi:hypothetical protein